VQAAVGSNVSRLEVLEFLRSMLERGKPGGRRAAAKALAAFHGAEANSLLMERLDDPDPQVQAALLAQLRERSIPGALTQLITALDSPHAAIREAARGSLTEFTFRRFVGTFDALEDEVRRTTGQLVKKVDLQALPLLLEELRSPVRARRLRAMSLAVAMELAREAEDELLTRLEEEDHLMRAAAVRALAASGTPRARAAIRETLGDRSATVQRVAEECLLELAEPIPGRSSAQAIPPLDLPSGLLSPFAERTP
jgi:HEAT repeat protein